MEVRQVFGAPGEEHVARTQVAFCSRCGSKMELRVVAGLPRSRCPECGHIHYVNPLPGVAVLVMDGDRLLLVRRASRSYLAPDLWCLPGGAIEYLEDWLTAGRREVLEESGFDVRITRLLTVTTNFFPRGLSTFVAVALAEPIGGEPTPSVETSEVAWFDPSALPEMAFESDVHLIERFVADRSLGLPVDASVAGPASP